SFKFNEDNSIGNEEDRIIDKNGMFATIALFVLTGGIYGLVALILDMKKLKTLNMKISGLEKTLIILSIFIPFVSICSDIFFNEKFVELEQKYELKLVKKPSLCIVFSVFFPLFMNPVSLGIRTHNFNKISDKLSEESI
ncbi:MAG: hypothetical protein MJ231_08580, partial [bacterium]|nr:hypothetical protein [bacterium]